MHAQESQSRLKFLPKKKEQGAVISTSVLQTSNGTDLRVLIDKLILTKIPPPLVGDHSVSSLAFHSLFCLSQPSGQQHFSHCKVVLQISWPRKIEDSNSSKINKIITQQIISWIRDQLVIVICQKIERYPHQKLMAITYAYAWVLLWCGQTTTGKGKRPECPVFRDVSELLRIIPSHNLGHL